MNARRRTLVLTDVLGEDQDQDAADSVDQTSSPADAPAASTAVDNSPREEDAAQTARPPRKTAQKGTRRPRKAAPAPAPAAPADEPRVLAAAVGTPESKAVSLYLHIDDWRALKTAHLEDGADLNARIRSMIALYRSNKQFRGRVDKLARSAPRGGGR